MSVAEVTTEFVGAVLSLSIRSAEPETRVTVNIVHRSEDDYSCVASGGGGQVGPPCAGMLRLRLSCEDVAIAYQPPVPSS
jgi:hypothetical protein